MKSLRSRNNRSTADGDLAREHTFDGFISYSHAADGELAPAIQSALHRFAKPWYRLRALRIFRDTTSLSVTPELWPRIRAMLDDSRYFVLLASPAAAASKWVQMEVDHWVTTKPVMQLLIAVTDGQIVWDPIAQDFDWAQTTALPPNLAGKFREEPLYLDFRPIKTPGKLSARAPDFQGLIASLSATLHGRAKDEMIGQDIAEHRRTKRIAAGAVVALVILMVAAVAGAVVAMRQAGIARLRAQIAESRRLAALSDAHRGKRLDRALLLAVEANDAHFTREARDSLYRCLTVRPGLRTFLANDMYSPHDAKFSPNGRILAVSSGAEVIFFDVDTRVKGTTLNVPRGQVTTVAYSHDGKLLAAGWMAFGRVITSGAAIFDIANGKQLRDEQWQDGVVHDLAFAADDQTLAAVSDTQLVQLPVDKSIPATYLEPASRNNEQAQLRTVDYSPNGQMLIVSCVGRESSDLTFVKLDAREYQIAQRIAVPEGRITSTTFSGDRKFLAVGYENGAAGGVIVIDTPSWGRLHAEPIQLSEGPVACLSSSNDFRLLAVGYAHADGGGLVLIDGVSGKRFSVQPARFPERHMTGVAVDSEGQTAAAAFSNIEADGITGTGGVALLDVRVGNPLTIARPLQLDRQPSALAAGPHSDFLAAADKAGVLLFNPLAPQQPPRTLAASEGYLFDLAITPDGARLAAGYQDASGTGIILFDTTTKQRLATTRPVLEGVRISSISFNNSGDRLAVLCSREGLSTEEVLFLDGMNLSVISSGAPPVKSGRTDRLVVAPDGMTLASVAAGGIQFFDAQTRNRVESTFSPALEGEVMDVQFTPDSQSLAVILRKAFDEGTLRFYAKCGPAWAQRGEDLKLIPLAHILAFSPDGKTLVTGGGSNRAITLLSSSGDVNLRNVLVTEGYPDHLAFSTDGRLLAVAYGNGSDGGIALIDVQSRQRIGTDPFPLPNLHVMDLVFSSSNNVLAARCYGAGDSFVLFDVELSSWRRRAGEIANRNLTQSEWEQYFPEEPYRRTFSQLPENRD